MNTRLVVGAVAAILVAATGGSALADQHHGFLQTNLISDVEGQAAKQDTLLVNPWGIIADVHGGVRVSDNGSGVSTAYTRRGASIVSTITIPPAGAGNPTGIVRSFHGSFMIPSGSHARPARLIFASEDGSISAWNPEIDEANAIQVVAGSDASVYKGVAIAGKGHEARLLVPNFRAGRVDVFDEHFAPVTGGFTDDSLPAGYAPFDIAVIHDRVYVTYAMQDADKHDDVPGPGLGIIDVFDAHGRGLFRFATGGALNAPWGMALAPKKFGEFGGDLLVGNFGDGAINAFDTEDGHFEGSLTDTSGATISISGLWGLAFASKAEDEEDCDNDEKETPTLFFAAGIAGEAHGLLGTIRAAEKDKDEDGDDDHDGDHHENGDGHHGGRAAIQVAVAANPIHLSRATAVQLTVSADPPATVRLRIYDAAGRLVAEPMRDIPISGSVVTRWNILDRRGVRVPPGTYFYDASGSGGAARGRFVLLR